MPAAPISDAGAPEGWRPHILSSSFILSSYRKTLKFTTITLFILGLFTHPNEHLWGNVTSSKGNISFDVDGDSNPEATLSSNGLGIGVQASVNLEVSGNAIISTSLAVGSGSPPTAGLYVSGSVGFSLTTHQSDSSLGEHSFNLADTSSGSFTLTLPEAVDEPGSEFTVKKTSLLNKVWINGGGDIDNFSEVELTSGNMGSLKVISFSGNWSIISATGYREGPWKPRGLEPSLVAWFDGQDSSSINLVGGNVSQWNDVSGNGNDALQANTDYQPTYGNGNIFWNDSNYMQTTRAIDLTDFSIFIIQEVYEDSNLFGAHDTGNNFQFRVKTSGTNGRISFYDGTTFLSQNGGTTDEISIYSCLRSSSDVYLYSDGNLAGQGTAGDAVSLGTFHAFRPAIGAVKGSGNINEILIVDRHLSESERRRMEGYLAHKWGTVSNLPTDHPYINFAP